MKPTAKSKQIPLTQPGQHLREAMEDWGLSQYQLAKGLGVQQTRIMEILKGRRAITADTALRLARFFDTSEEFWLQLQMNYDIAKARRRLGARVKKEIEPVMSKQWNRDSV